MPLAGANDAEKLKDLASRSYRDQAVWFLNAFWNGVAKKEAENVWKYVLQFVKLDLEKGKQGNQLDEVMTHRFLEVNDNTHTVRELREKLYAIGIEKPKFVALIHYLIFHYAIDWHELLHAPQGNQDDIDRAQQMLEAVQTALKEAQTAAADLARQENEFNSRTKELELKSTVGTAVQQNKAKAELAQHLASDPLPLRKAKITNEAAVKKLLKKVHEAEAYLEEVKQKPGAAAGAMWWLDRELHEAKAYMPQAKGGYQKKA